MATVSSYISTKIYIKKRLNILTLEVPITTAADDSLIFIVFLKKEEDLHKTSSLIDISCEFFARQRIHIKHQVLFSSKAKDKSKKEKINKSVVYCSFAWLLKSKAH